LLVEGGADLAWQILQDGLMDVLHIFRSDAPAGGKIVALDGLGLGPPTKSVRFDGGCWEIWERQTWEPIAKPSGFAIQRSC
jgi:riboflavin biosynthesis pyrimidine reductase